MAGWRIKPSVYPVIRHGFHIHCARSPAVCLSALAVILESTRPEAGASKRARRPPSMLAEAACRRQKCSGGEARRRAFPFDWLLLAVGAPGGSEWRGQGSLLLSPGRMAVGHAFTPSSPFWRLFLHGLNLTPLHCTIEANRSASLCGSGDIPPAHEAFRCPYKISSDFACMPRHADGR